MAHGVQRHAATIRETDRNMIENTAFIALSRQTALRRQMDVIANNVANMNTAAYKNQRMLFEEYLVKPAAETRLSFVQDVAVFRDLSAGEMKATGNPLDVAIDGAGYFIVESGGAERYTRNGHFRVDAEGTLVTADGAPVLDVDRRPILLDPNERELTIGRDGTISGALGPIAQVAVVEFDDPHGLKALGGSLYRTNQEPLPVETPVIIQGMIEGSNVAPVLEMTKLTTLARSYQSTQRLIENDHDLRRRTIRALGRVG